MSPEALRRALDAAPKRTKIEGMRSVRIYSDVLFAATPDRPHALTFSAAFPKRSRLSLRPVTPRDRGQGTGGRSPNLPPAPSPPGLSERYQLGDAVYGRDVLANRPPADSQSYGQTGAAAAETRLDFALRRCAFFWPDEGKFEGAGWSRTTKVDGIGVLLLRLDPKSQLPTDIRALGASGATEARLTAIEWQEIDGRPWPKRFEFWAGGSKVWSETVTAIEGEWLLGDPWFLPSDRIGEVVGRKSGDRLRMRVRGASQIRTLPAPEGQTVEAALAAAMVEWRKQEAALGSEAPRAGEPAPPTLLRSAALILGAGGEVEAMEFEATVPLKDAPPWPGWTAQPAKSEWVYLLGDTRPTPDTDGGKGFTEEVLAAQALLEAPAVVGSEKTARRSGSTRLRFEILDRGSAGPSAVQKRLTRAAQEDSLKAPKSPPRAKALGSKK